MDDAVDLSVKRSSSPSDMPNQSRQPPKSPRLPDTPIPKLEIPMPLPQLGFNHLPPTLSNLIPQVQVPHDLTRLVSLLRDREREDVVSTTSGPGRGSRPSQLLANDLSSLFLQSQAQPNQTPRQPQTPRKQSHVTGVKRKKQEDDGDVFQHPIQQHSSSSHAVRRSLRPRAERSYAESPDIVVDYEDEQPQPSTKILNGISSTNGNGHVKDTDMESDASSDCGEMPPLPVIKELTSSEVEARERLLEKLREGVRNEEMKLVLLKKLRQSQMMKENVCLPDSPNSGGNVNGVGGTVGSGTNCIGGSSSLLTPQSPVHNNQLGMTNLQGINMASGAKNRSSPKLPPGTSLSINSNLGTPTHLGGLTGLRLTQHGNTTGLNLPLQQGNAHRQHGSPYKGNNSSKVPSLLKGQQSQPSLARGSLSNSHNIQSSSMSSLMMPPQRSSSNSISHNILLAQAQQSLLRGSRTQGSTTSMMANFTGTPPGGIPPPTISPAVDKYERPKDAHSGSASASQLLGSSGLLEGKLSGNCNNLGGSSIMLNSSTTANSNINSGALAPNLNIGVPLPPTLDQAERRHRLATTGEEERETPAQRQAAAKLALRKQLEKTLLQIPPPKPPPPEMNFIPNPNNMEFLALIGLEFVVDYITKDAKSGPKYPDAVVCNQCKTDFSSMWKIDKGKVICEQCATSNAKKSLKAEHTNRLKTAFVQALQQEQEIEQRLAQGGSLAETLASAGTTVRATSTPSPNHNVIERDHRSPQLISSTSSSNRNRTPTQSPGLGHIPLSLPIRDRERERDQRERDHEREQRDRERELHRDREREREQKEQREIRDAISAITAAQHQQLQQHAHKELRERDSGRERGSSSARAAAAAAANESLLNLSTHNQPHNFSQQLRHEMAQLAQLHEQQFQQQHLQQQLQQQQRHSSKGQGKSSGNGSSLNLSVRGDKRDRERGGEAYRLEREHNSAAASSLLSQTLAQTMANQFMSHGLQNLSMGQQPSASGTSHSSPQSKPSQATGTSRRGPRTSDQSYKQPVSKQQKLDADAAAKFASAMGMSGATAGGMGLNPNAVAAALQAAAHQQMLRMPQNQQLPAHLFSPLLYPYQMAMAQAASSGKQLPQASLAELQRQAENLQQLQRQYLLDMIPNSRNLPQNWKT